LSLYHETVNDRLLL